MNSASSQRPLALAIFSSLLFTAVVYIVLSSLWKLQIIPCTDTWANNLILALTLAFVLQFFIAPKILPGQFRSVLAVHAVLIVLTLWLALYPISPLGYSSGRIPILSGFLVIRANRDSIVRSNQVISLSQGVAVGINPMLLPGDFECNWTSAAEGALDDPASCDTVYVPPGTDFDILRLRIRSTCGLPDTNAQLKISILP